MEMEFIKPEEEENVDVEVTRQEEENDEEEEEEEEEEEDDEENDEHLGDSGVNTSGSSSNDGGGGSEEENFKRKYKFLKRRAKEMIFVNAAYCDEVVRMEERIVKAKEERRRLLNKVLQQQTLSEVLSLAMSRHSGVAQATSDGETAHSSSSRLLPIANSSPSSFHLASLASSTAKERHGEEGGDRKGMEHLMGLPQMKRKRVNSQAEKSSKGLGKRKDVAEESPLKKMRKGKGGQAGKRVVPPIPLDNLGRPVFPIELGDLTVYCFGEIVPEKSGFHTAEHIYPSGYCSTRVYASIDDPTSPCLYTCKITEGSGGPHFEISLEDSSDRIIAGSSISKCHLALLQAINSSRTGEPVPVNAKAEAFFGLSHPCVQHLIQSCYGAKRCSRYKWVKFECSKTGDPYVEMDPAVSWKAYHSRYVEGRQLDLSSANLSTRRSPLAGLVTGSASHAQMFGQDT